MPFELNPPAPDQGLGWFQAGAMIGARNADRALQAQEMRSKEAERVVRERNLAAELQHIELQNQQLNVSIQKRAADEAEYGNAMHSADAAYKIAEAASDPEQTSLPSPQDFRDRAALQIADNPMAEQHLKTVGLFEQKKAMSELYSDRAKAIASGSLASGKTPADLIKAKALEDAQNAVNNASALLENASTDEERTAAEATVKSADLHLKSIQAAMHVLSPEDKKIQLQTINGQTYLFRGNSAPHLVSDPVQKAKLAIAQKRLGDVEQQIGDIEASTRLKPEEQTKRLAPLLKQRDALRSVFESVTAPKDEAPAPVAPAPSPGDSPIPPRPPGMSDDDLKREAQEAISQKRKDPAWIKRALEAWGVK